MAQKRFRQMWHRSTQRVPVVRHLHKLQDVKPEQLVVLALSVALALLH